MCRERFPRICFADARIKCSKVGQRNVPAAQTVRKKNRMKRAPSEPEAPTAVRSSTPPNWYSDRRLGTRVSPRWNRKELERRQLPAHSQIRGQFSVQRARAEAEGDERVESDDAERVERRSDGSQCDTCTSDYKARMSMSNRQSTCARDAGGSGKMEICRGLPTHPGGNQIS